MASNPNLRVKISADLADIKQGLSLLRGELAKVKAQAAQTAPDTSGWSKGLSGIRQQVLDVAAAYLSWRAIGGIVRGVFDSFDKMDRIDELGQMVALSAEDLSKFAYAAQFSGVELEALGKGFSFFQRNLGKNGELLGKLGVDAPNLIGKLRQIMDVFKQLPDGPEKASLAAELFGSRLGGNLIPLLNEGADGFDRLSGEAERTGNVFDQAAVEGAAKFNDNLDTLKSTLTGVFNVAAQQLAPSMAAYAGAANDAAQESSAAAEGGKFLATVFKVVATGGVIVKNVIEAVVGVLGFLADVAIETGKMVITSLGGAFTTVGATLKAYLTGGPVAAFNTFTAQVRENAGAVMGASRDMRNQLRGSWDAMRAGFADASSDIANAFVGALAEVDTAGATAKQAIGEVGDEADTASKKGEALRKMLAALFGEGGGNGGKDKALAASSALQRDSVTRAIAEVERLYKASEIGTREYFATLTQLQQQAIDLQIQQARNELAVTKDKGQRLKLEEEITILQRDRAEITQRNARDEKQASDAMIDKLGDVKAQLAELDGDAGKAARIRIYAQFHELFKQLEVDSDETGKALVRNLADRLVAKAQAEAIAGRVSSVTSGLGAQEQSISAQMEAGALGQGEGERRLQEIRQKSLEQLRQLREEQRLYLAGLAAGTPEHAAAVEGLASIDTSIANVIASQQKFSMAVQDQAASSLGGFFDDLIDGAKSFKDAFTDMVRSFLSGIAKMIAQELALRAVRGLFSMFSGGGGVTASAKGNVFDGSGLRAFARGAAFPAIAAFAAGGAFTNQVVASPTLFQFGKGGQLGVMGEAGPEAIMPLERGPGGRLGVRNNSGAAPQAPAKVVVVFGEAELANAMAGAAGEAVTVAHVRNNWGALNGG